MFPCAEGCREYVVALKAGVSQVKELKEIGYG